MRRIGLKRRVSLSLKQGRRKARSLGLTYHVASPDQLLLDIDTEHQWGQFEWMLPYLRRYLHIEVEQVIPSRSGEDQWHKHVYLRLGHDLEPTERLLLQALLGSDPMKEWLGLLRVWGRVKEPIQLFESSDRAKDPTSC